MERRKLAIIHFQPVEKYPPVLNFVDCLRKAGQFAAVVCTTHGVNNVWRFKAPNYVSIFRFGKQALSPIHRYICYGAFNLLSFLKLLLFRPDCVLYYETYSIFPALLYKSLFPKTKLSAHYHEYLTLTEINKSSPYLRWLCKIERNYYKKIDSISHTNKDRLLLFKADYPELGVEKLKVIPNYPPAIWYQSERTENRRIDSKRVVYVGALSMDTMYTEVFSRWIVDQNGAYTLDIYTDNLAPGISEFLEGMNTSLIRLRKPLPYFELPNVLPNYDIGVVLYNGHIPNYVYNVPNKVIEYYACGLEVWCSKDLLSTAEFKADQKIETIKIVDFTNLAMSLACINSEPGGSNESLKRKKTFCAEDVYLKAIDQLMN